MNLIDGKIVCSLCDDWMIGWCRRRRLSNVDRLTFDFDRLNVAIVGVSRLCYQLHLRQADERIVKRCKTCVFLSSMYSVV